MNALKILTHVTKTQIVQIFLAPTPVHVVTVIEATVIPAQVITIFSVISYAVENSVSLVNSHISCEESSLSLILTTVKKAETTFVVQMFE